MSTRLTRFQDRLRVARQGGAKIDIPFLLEAAAQLREAEDRARWLEKMMDWVRLSGGAGTSHQTSLRFLLLRLEQNPAWKSGAAEAMRRLMLESSYVSLFSETGVHSNYDFIQESVSRMVRRFFPPQGEAGDMEVLVDRAFSRKDDGAWAASLLPEVKAQLAQWLFAEPTFATGLREHLIAESAEATYFLCIRASAIAVQRDMMARAGIRRIAEVPSVRVRPQAREFYSALLAKKGRDEVRGAFTNLLAEIEAARGYLNTIHSHLEQYGVSVRLVFSIECASSILDRIETLARLSFWLRFGEGSFDPWAFFAKLLRDANQETRIGPLWKSNLHLLSRKIVERAGETGKSYITGNKAEYRAMFFAAVGGGVVTAFTGLAKFWGPSSGAPFMIGLYAALNYSLSFLLMHHLHFKLATKQPAMTAAALAGSLHGRGEGGTAEFVDLVARIVRSQFAAVAGNILAVVPTALLVDFLARRLGHPVVHAGYEAATLQSLHPFATLTVAYAALTGVVLWASGTIAGWVENAYVYFRVPKALAGHPTLGLLFGETLLTRAVDGVSRNLAGWISSIALGCLLAFVPIMGSFFGLPLDVRHVTLSTGAATYSFAAIGWEHISGQLLAFTTLGIALIGMMNFGVSFAFALHVAVRARDISRKRVAVVLKACLAELIRRPGKFFFP